jgi:1,2-diacylglycerol 3-beta-galactosyltransferase
MVISVATPRKSLTEKVFQRVGGYYGSISGNSQRRCSNESEDDYDEDGTMELVQIGAERTKNVLILMSDTGGGHRASAEAIRDAFQIEFGNEYRVIRLESLLGSRRFRSICIFPFPLLSLSLLFFIFYFLFF